MRTFLPIALALAALSATPALASAEACNQAPAKLRAMAATAQPEAARKAERNIALGEALCEARNRPEAAKKFDLAAATLGTNLAALLAPVASATVQ